MFGSKSCMFSVCFFGQEYTVAAFLRQKWRDERLAFKTYDDRNLLQLNYDLYDRIWVPDLYIPNLKGGNLFRTTTPNRMIRLYPDGDVHFSQG